MPEKENEQLGGLTGIAAGVLAGAALGSSVLPVVGTFLGGLAGGIMGSEVGRVVGGGILNAIDPYVPGGQPAEAPKADIAAQLERLGQLRTQGLITDDEFTAAKAKILGL